MESLSFAQGFFFPEGVDPYMVKSSDYPTTVLQAIISLPKREKVGIARDILKVDHPVLYTMSEEFPFKVMDKVKETDLCDDGYTPVTVYIDPNQWYSVMVYGERYCDCGEELDRDCSGELRCSSCDGPCPQCDDGGM